MKCNSVCLYFSNVKLGKPIFTKFYTHIATVIVIIIGNIRYQFNDMSSFYIKFSKFLKTFKNIAIV